MLDGMVKDVSDLQTRRDREEKQWSLLTGKLEEIKRKGDKDKQDFEASIKKVSGIYSFPS